MSSRITHNPDQCGGRPCIRGMRIRVQDILELYAAGQSGEQILVGAMPVIPRSSGQAGKQERRDHPRPGLDSSAERTRPTTLSALADWAQ